jgi:hypothetical protein
MVMLKIIPEVKSRALLLLLLRPSPEFLFKKMMPQR